MDDPIAEAREYLAAHDAHTERGDRFDGLCYVCNPEDISPFDDLLRALLARADEAAGLADRWTRALDYARSLPVDQPVTGWTVLDALQALEHSR